MEKSAVEETVDWQIQCVKCGHTRDAEAAGITRYWGWSWKRYIVSKCPECDKIRFHVYKRKEVE